MTDFALNSGAEQELRNLKRICDQIRGKIQEYQPKELLGGLCQMVLLSLMSRSDNDGRFPPISQVEKPILFVMEYLHATYAADGILEGELKCPDASAIEELIELARKALGYCIRFGRALDEDQKTISSDWFEQRESIILTNWVFIRGRRFPVMEQEFFKFVLDPHNDILQELYGLTSDALSLEIQKMVTSIREGINRAYEAMDEAMGQISEGTKASNENFKDFLENPKQKKPEVLAKCQSAIDDIFWGGTFNISKHTNLPKKLLSDLAFKPGEEDRFDDGSKFSGTPFQTLPARIKPLINLEEQYYCTDPYLIRDGLYRSIQRAIIARKRSYKEQWNKRQKEMSETAFADLLSDSLETATVLVNVYYRNGKRKWTETDCVILIDDVLICVEVKAGTESLDAPSRDIESHSAKVETLIVKAYNQSKRFIEYVFATDEAPLYAKGDDGKCREIARIRKVDYRKVFPVGLIVEAFTPFSTFVNKRDDVVPIIEKFNFISLSIDDLMILKRLFPSTGEFLHYLDVRQALAGMKNAFMLDEMDPISAYISTNRVDQRITSMIAEQNTLHYVHSDEVNTALGLYFGDPDWPNCEIPRQIYPAKTQELLDALSSTAKAGWLSADTFIRDLSDEDHQNFSDYFDQTFPILTSSPFMHFTIDTGDGVVMFRLIKGGYTQVLPDLIRECEAVILAVEQPEIWLFEIFVLSDARISSASARLIK